MDRQAAATATAGRQRAHGRDDDSPVQGAVDPQPRIHAGQPGDIFDKGLQRLRPTPGLRRDVAQPLRRRAVGLVGVQQLQQLAALVRAAQGEELAVCQAAAARRGAAGRAGVSSATGALAG